MAIVHSSSILCFDAEPVMALLALVDPEGSAWREMTVTSNLTQ